MSTRWYRNRMAPIAVSLALSLILLLGLTLIVNANRPVAAHTAGTGSLTDETFSSMEEGLPVLQIEKEQTRGMARPGGIYIYKIRYWNNGNGPAENTLITDTLPANTSYFTDTGGFLVTDDDDTVSWELGTVPAGSYGEFYVAVWVDAAAAGDNLGDNCVDISSASPDDPDLNNNHSCTGGPWVDTSDVGIGIRTRPSPNDPHPGQEFAYILDYWSDTGAATGPVWLTATLPVSTTFVSWDEEWGWDGLWTEVVTTGGQLVLHAPAGIPGDMGGLIRLTLKVDEDAPVGTVLTHHVVAATAEDVNTDNNEETNTDARVSGTRYDLWLDKSSQGGDQTPGGTLNYNLHYENRGNVAAHAWLTDSLPAGTTYREDSAGYWDESGRHALDPISVSGSEVVWDLGVISVARGGDLNFAVDVDPSASSGEIENCATIGSDAGDTTPGDNADCATTDLYPDGPNLKVTQSSTWQGDQQLGYQIEVQNIGDEPLEGVLVTDTYPLSATFGGWGPNGEHPFEIDGPVHAPGARQLVWTLEKLEPGGGFYAWVNIDLDSNERMRWYTNTVETVVPDDDPSPDDNVATDVAFSGGEVDRIEVQVRPYSHGNLWGNAVPGPITVTTPYTEAVVWADAGCDGCWSVDDAGPLGAGDDITVVAGEGRMPVTFSLPDPFTTDVDSAADMITGQVGDWHGEMLEIHGYWPGGDQEVTTGNDGTFAATYNDVPRGAGGQIRYVTEATYAELIVHREFMASDLLVTVDYGNDGVDANYEPGHTGWVTVTNASGTEVKAVVEVTTAVWPDWGGNAGFSTHHHPWSPQQPDIEPGDRVHAALDNGVTTTVQIGTIETGIDVEDDVIIGSLEVPWYTEGLMVRCEIHEPWAPDGIEVYGVSPNGGTFSCDFSEVWDIVPGQALAVSYTEPDGDRVQTRPENPAPHLRIEKRLEGEKVSADGNAVFEIEYWNDGDMAAENVVVTDTLEGMTFITDTSGFPMTVTGSGSIVWEVGTVEPGDWVRFYVFAEVTADADDDVSNLVEIATTNAYDQGDPEEKRGEWRGTVGSDPAQLNINKYAWTGDPAAGQDVVFQIDPCNQSDTASAAVTITDTLHPSMTLKSWSQEGAGWTEVLSSSGRLVLSRPAISAWRCEPVYVVATIDAGAECDMAITNTATLSAANDADPNDNTWTWEGQVSDPYLNLSIDKSFGSGRLVPGGELRYWIRYDNNGNIPAGTFRITDTLPVSTTFRSASYHDGDESHPITPTITTPGSVVWEFEGLDNGYGNGFEVILGVDSDAVPGTVLTNTAAISPLPDEDTYHDNESVWVETLFDHGPNLRVRKQGQWDNGGENTRRASYWLNVENVGDVPVHDVNVTDTYPAGMYMDSGLGLDYWEWWHWAENGDHFTVTLELLEPGWSVGMNFSLITDTEPLPFGLIFTNIAEVNLVDGDVNPADNRDVAVLTTGPDLYVEKTLVAGDLLPGEVITFSLVFGNDRQWHEWWWHTQGEVWITDTLPAGFTFINATQRSAGGAPFLPNVQDGDRLAWNVGGMGPSQQDEILLTMQIPSDATGLDTFTNRVRIASSDPAQDKEPYVSNNADQVTFDIALPYFEVAKVYESSRVAGTPITYTLTVTNNGSVAGTNVLLSDTVPAGLTGIDSNGVDADGDVTWTFESIARCTTRSGWFSALLPCTTGPISNADYGVVASDQGVTGSGDPVVVNVVAPSLSVTLEDSSPSVVAGKPVALTAEGSTNGSPFNYTWDFGGGSSADSATTSHVFAVDGTYPVTVTVTDGCGYTAEAVATVTVTPPELNADFSSVPPIPNIVKGESVQFADTSTTDGPAIVDWAWDFGDGSTSPLQNPTHTYQTVGTFDVTLTVTDALGYTDTVVKKGLVNVALGCTPLSSVSITTAPATPLINETVTFEATVLPTAASAPLTYTWTFGDGNGTTVNVPTVEHAYTTDQTFTVGVTVYNPCTPAGVTTQVQLTVTPYRVYLPLTLNGTP